MFSDPNQPFSTPKNMPLQKKERDPNKEFSVIINPSYSSKLVLSSWPINVFPEDLGMEGERITVKRGSIHYSLVFYDTKCYAEILREVDEAGTLETKEIIPLPYK